MRRTIAIMLAVCTMAMFTACGSEGSKPQENSDSIQIVTTIFPEYDWVRNLLGDNPAGAEVTMLLDSGVDLHSFQPASEDMMKISSCDVFVYVGGESDKWVDEALAGAANKDMIVIDLMEALGDDLKEEEKVEGMQEEAEESSGADREEGRQLDEHIWLSPENAEEACEVIEKALAEADPDNAAVYEKNLAAYKEKLENLDEAYEDAVSQARVKTLLFGDRFPFRYLTDEYGLDYFAAFSGCSSETEASFETIRFLAEKVDELGLSSVMTIENSDGRIAETIIENTKAKDQKVLAMDSMQSVTSEDAENGASYLQIMETNLGVLKEALQ